MCIHFFLQNHIYAILIQQPSLKIFTNRQNPQTNRNTKKMHTHTLAQILSETRRRRRAAPSEKPPFLAAVSRHTITHGLAFNLRSTIRSTYTRGHTRTPLAHNVRYNVRVHRRHRCRALRVGGGEVINRFYTRILAGRCRRRRRRRGDAIILRSRSVAWKCRRVNATTNTTTELNQAGSYVSGVKRRRMYETTNQQKTVQDNFHIAVELWFPQQDCLYFCVAW